MSLCSAWGCSNNSKQGLDKSFFTLPKDLSTKNAWIAAMNLKRLPSRVYLCSDHFDDSCFDAAWKLQNELYYKDRPVKRRLITGSIPTKFPHKKVHEERNCSAIHASKKQHKEV